MDNINLSGLNWFFMSVIANLALIIISMIGHWLTTSQEFAKKKDVQEMIESSNELTQNELRHLIEARDKMTAALKDNTEAIQSLRVELTEIRHGRTHFS